MAADSTPEEFPLWRTAAAALLLIAATQITRILLGAVIGLLTEGATPAIARGFTFLMMPVLSVTGYAAAGQLCDLVLRRRYDGELIFFLIAVANVIAVLMSLFNARLIPLGKLGVVISSVAGVYVAYRMFYCKPNP